ncbi:MAG: hypothetical protein A2312_04105 [Candidatus Staskawiczbacteria bacterium RIFOXYB2_FULL_32_9]|uniref:Uncharacterized protein n=1 Tax=Candidatus Staskawiczbacteria bacterium RIFOXYD1_FULL_32_13 TaxID=1802234 RepID=A0A1G2JRC6_9BACT|nr:MAG: hypothetical protein UR22_C0020G0004 [Parcubacteria group bacterium GW2011_GWC2_32_10]OGZ77963.1 MAG: hypothetical protein A2256_01710 [Candidatus Staskawiczbacteria bacterium RIFOXYA2_FULL_32_7]OGZ80936.1 MAG: hypothetical protein A2360_01460 [Candidatus Staskawiczbacteria bacterium RIFOXYB1_FULL_32_11]OGZ84214.1 MAG: hypothetical protein A2312_04105 [Candidatus Staskawiczbacteria bacterium RIFOXYB2_FULL_32_9]OGZ87904.1 MAG: hypothetical protein A2463_00875 [Candidatus Staskawiczbacter
MSAENPFIKDEKKVIELDDSDIIYGGVTEKEVDEAMEAMRGAKTIEELETLSETAKVLLEKHSRAKEESLIAEYKRKMRKLDEEFKIK